MLQNSRKEYFEYMSLENVKEDVSINKEKVLT